MCYQNTNCVFKFKKPSTTEYKDDNSRRHRIEYRYQSIAEYKDDISRRV